MSFTHVGGVAGKYGTIAMQQKIGKLRKRIAELEQVVVERKQCIRQLRTENAKLRKLVNSYADSFEKDAAMNNGCGPYYSGEDWLALANDMRIELAECCGELGVEANDA